MMFAMPGSSKACALAWDKIDEYVGIEMILSRIEHYEPWLKRIIENA